MRVVVLALIVFGLYAPAASAKGVAEGPLARASAVCADYPNQAAAQRAADTRDADGDGLYCESLPCPCLGAGGSGGSGGGSDDGAAERKRAAAKAKEKARAKARARARARERARKRAAARRERKQRDRYEGRVQIVRVIDGDTVRVRLKSGALITVALVGTEAPEATDPDVGPECGGLEALAALRTASFLAPVAPATVAEGKFATLDTDETQPVKDDSGHVLAYLDTEDGLDLGQTMLRAGWSQYMVIERDPRRARRYQRAHDAASAERVGVWGLCGGDFDLPRPVTTAAAQH